MRITRPNLIIFILFVIAGGCNKANPLLEMAPLGAYQYRAYDTTGVLIVKGWFTPHIVDSIHISGDWYLKQVSNHQIPGPQVGVGKLAGAIYQGILEINLNPQYKDNNVFLVGRIVGNSYTGTWIWNSYIGNTNWGRFTANK